MSQQQQDHAYMECKRAIAGLLNERNALTQIRLTVRDGLAEIVADLSKECPEWSTDKETANLGWSQLWELKDKLRAIDAELAERQAERDRYHVL